MEHDRAQSGEPLWEAPTELVRQLAVDVESPLEMGLVHLCATVAGFTAIATAARP